MKKIKLFTIIAMASALLITSCQKPNDATNTNETVASVGVTTVVPEGTVQAEKKIENLDDLKEVLPYIASDIMPLMAAFGEGTEDSYNNNISSIREDVPAPAEPQVKPKKEYKFTYRTDDGKIVYTEGKDGTTFETLSTFFFDCISDLGIQYKTNKLSIDWKIPAVNVTLLEKDNSEAQTYGSLFKNEGSETAVNATTSKDEASKGTIKAKIDSFIAKVNAEENEKTGVTSGNGNVYAKASLDEENFLPTIPNAKANLLVTAKANNVQVTIESEEGKEDFSIVAASGNVNAYLGLDAALYYEIPDYSDDAEEGDIAYNGVIKISVSLNADHTLNKDLIETIMEFANSEEDPTPDEFEEFISSMPGDVKVTISSYDIKGEKIADLISETTAADIFTTFSGLLKDLENEMKQ